MKSSFLRKLVRAGKNLIYPDENVPNMFSIFFTKRKGKTEFDYIVDFYRNAYAHATIYFDETNFERETISFFPDELVYYWIIEHPKEKSFFTLNIRFN